MVCPKGGLARSRVVHLGPEGGSTSYLMREGNWRSRKATNAELQKFWGLLKKGLSIKQAAELTGFSATWGYKQVREHPEVSDQLREAGLLWQKDKADKLSGVNEQRPIVFDSLLPIYQEALGDFNLFCELFFCRHPSPWRLIAAKEVTMMLTDRLRKPDPEDWIKFFVDINCPPGVGKTTCFTHDMPVWLICGGGTLDPSFGRALRVMLGSRTKNVAIHFTGRVRRTFERRNPFFDKATRQTAEHKLIQAYGYFKPKAAEGDPDSVWRINEFTVAQVTGIDLYEMEPTVQAASQESGFLGERVDYYSWDDLATMENSSNAQTAASLAEWFENQAETRVEPGGVGALVGQRLNNLDLHRNRLDSVFIDDEGKEQRQYIHIKFPAHFDEYCDGHHRQWDGATSGCLLDARRLPWGDLIKKQAQANYRTVYQQEDADPETILVQPGWITGQPDFMGYQGPGCLDFDRGFLQWPEARGLIDVMCVDPSATNWWAMEWWSVDPKTHLRWLIWGARMKMQASDYLDFDMQTGKLTGIMEEMQIRSGQLGHPIGVWVIEQNAAHRYLTQTNAFRLWTRKWSRSHVITHETQRNKADKEFGIQAALPGVYRNGSKRLPALPEDREATNYRGIKVKELTNYPHFQTWDTVMVDWFLEFRMRDILRIGAKALYPSAPKPIPGLPAYLQRQRQEVQLSAP